MRYLSVRREIEGSLPTVAELLRQKGEDDAFRVMNQADIEIAQVGYDSWNGSTELWTVFLRVPVSVFVSIEGRRDEIAGIISKKSRTRHGQGLWILDERRDLADARVAPRTRTAEWQDWRSDAGRHSR